MLCSLHLYIYIYIPLSLTEAIAKYRKSSQEDGSILNKVQTNWPDTLASMHF